MKFKISVPATSANLGSGFDLLGLALNIHNHFIFEILPKDHPDSFSFTVSELVAKTGEGKNILKMEQGRKNLIIKSFKLAFSEAGKAPPPMRIHADINIPFSRGLGSSSTAIAGGLSGANNALLLLYNFAFSESELLTLALRLENHPDNLAAAFRGGMVLCLPPEKKDSKLEVTDIALKLPIQLAGIIPHKTLETQKARKVVPQKISTQEAVFQMSRIALLIKLLNKQSLSDHDAELFKKAMQDKLHQKQRAKFLPGLLESLSLFEEFGAYGAYLSGAGTTIMGIWPPGLDVSVIPLEKEMNKKNISCAKIFPEIDKQGTICKNL